MIRRHCLDQSFEVDRSRPESRIDASFKYTLQSTNGTPPLVEGSIVAIFKGKSNAEFVEQFRPIASSQYLMNFFIPLYL